jgi:hypothetical protein
MRKKLLGVLLVTLLAASVTPAFADSSPPVNYISANFDPITSSTSYNYDWSTGTLTAGTATASVFSTANVFQAVVADPTPPDPNGLGTFIGTARPVRSPTGGGAVLYEQSACPTGYPTCFFDGTFTDGYMVMYPLRGATLDQLTYLATQYYVEAGCFGGGSPRFSVVMSNATSKNREVQVYLGTYPAFADCPPPGWMSTGNLATDSAGLRWDSTQIGGPFYGTYSAAVTLANAQGYTVNEVILGTDGGWSGTNPATTQTFLFQKIQVNGLTRFS